MQDTAFEDIQKRDERLALEAGRQVLMGNFEPTHENDIGIGLYARNNLTSNNIQFLLNNSKEKKWDELLRFLNYMDFLLNEAEKWDALAAQWEAERSELIDEQNLDFERLKDIGKVLDAEPFDAEKAKALLDDFGVKVPEDVTDEELRRMLIKESEEIIARTEQRQKDIEEWTRKIEEAKRKAQELRDQADEYDRKMKAIYADQTLSPEQQGAKADQLRANVHHDVNLIRGFNGQDENEMKQERDTYAAKREKLIEETVPQADQSQSFFGPS